MEATIVVDEAGLVDLILKNVPIRLRVVIEHHAYALQNELQKIYTKEMKKAIPCLDGPEEDQE